MNIILVLSSAILALQPCYPSRIRTMLREADDFICQNLQHPQTGVADKLLNEIEFFNKNLEFLCGRVEPLNHPERRIIVYGEKVIKKMPRFLKIYIDEKQLKEKYGWTDDQLQGMYKLRAETKRLRSTLYKNCMKNCKYFFEQGDWPNRKVLQRSH